MVHLTCTVVGSSQANRQDSCEEKAGAFLLDPHLRQPTSSPLSTMAVGGEKGQRRPPDSEVGNSQEVHSETWHMLFLVFTGRVRPCEPPELTGEPDRSPRWVLPTWCGMKTRVRKESQQPHEKQAGGHMQGHGKERPESGC